jgi:hypothetical protein
MARHISFRSSRTKVKEELPILPDLESIRNQTDNIRGYYNECTKNK